MLFRSLDIHIPAQTARSAAGGGDQKITYLLKILLGTGIVLTIVCLILRDRTEHRLSILRAELMALRSEEQRLADLRNEIEIMVAQIGDALMRVESRYQTIDKSNGELNKMVEELRTAIKDKETGGLR